MLPKILSLIDIIHSQKKPETDAIFSKVSHLLRTAQQLRGWQPGNNRE
jgi:hypothetical protein